MGENICKWSNQQGINLQKGITLQNIQTAHAAQYKKNNAIKNWGGKI